MELKKDCSLFARLLIVSKLSKDVSLENAVGNFELSVVPRSLFSADGQMLPTQGKSKLMNILVDLPEQSEVDEPGNKSIEDSYTVALIDGMAEVQTLSKPDWIKNCEQLKYDHMDEIRVIFDPYDIPHSLKQATRARRTKNNMPMAYHITDHTNIAKVPLKKILTGTQ